MKVVQLYTGCMSHAAYYIENNGEAAIIDPLREVDPYIQRANQDNAQIKFVFETHFHADFVSGHLDLAKKTGASIVYGPTAQPNFPAIIATDLQEFKVGDYSIQVLHTPGHTLESSCYLLFDEVHKPYGIISGDTLFIGDVGRPDLAQHLVADLTEDKLARMLYHSLREKIMPLPDSLIVFPNHGAGSACGKNMSKETTDTLGHQKQTNYALNPALTEDEFVAVLLDGLAPPPGYFPKNVLLNKGGYESLDAVLSKANIALSVSAFERLFQDPSVLVLDTRAATQIAKGYIQGALAIALEGNFAMWVGELLADINQKIILICDPGKEKEALIRLSRVGYDHCIGYLEGGFASWLAAHKPIVQFEQVNSNEVANELVQHSHPIIDVRKKTEFTSEHLIGAYNIPLNELEKRLNELPAKELFYLHCAGGYRSAIAATILIKHGITNFIEIADGFAGLKRTDLPKTTYVCPSSML